MLLLKIKGLLLKRSETMRRNWFEHVAKTRRRMVRSGKKEATHKQAMTEASKTWPTVKAKLVRKLARVAKKEAKIAAASEKERTE